MARQNTSTAHIMVTMDGKQAVNLMSLLQRQAVETRKKLEAMKTSGMEGTDAYKKLLDELKAAERVINANRTAYIDLNKIVNNLGGTTLGQLQKALKECRKQMQNLTADDPKMKVLMAQYRAIDNQIGKITGQWKTQDGAIKSVMKRLAAYVSIYGGFNIVKSKLSEVISSNLAFSDQLADIRKTTGLSMESVEKLSSSIKQIDTRTSVQELHNLAYEAGRLGIGNMGADAVLGFVRAANQLTVALKEDLGDDAIVQLTKMADVMGLTKSMGVEKSLLSIGSAINELAQSSTASGSFMTDYASRLSGIATQAHLTMDQLLGFAAAADATGQEVEVSATAMNKFIVQLQTHYKTVANAAGISADKLHGLLEAGETAEAVVMVLDALGKKGGLSMLAPLMKDMGSDGARLTASLSTMASNIDLVRQQLETSKSAFEDAISVTNEYNVKNENAAAIMERMRNSWTKMFVDSSNVGILKDVAQDLYDLSKAVQENSFFINTLKVAIGTLVFAFKSLVNMLPYLTLFFSGKGILLFLGYLKSLWPEVIALRNSLIAATTAASANAAATTAAGNAAAGAATKVSFFSKALSLVGKALKSNVFLFAASAIATLIYKLVSVKQQLSDTQKSAQSLNKGFKEFTQSSHAAGIEVNILFTRLQNTAKGTKEHRDLIKQINQQYGDYLPSLLTEKSSLDEIAKAQETVNTKLRQSLALKAKNAAIDEAGQTYTPKMAEATSRIQEIYTAAGISGVGENDVQYLITQTQKYYDAGMKFADIRSKVWDELYRTNRQTGEMGRSAELVRMGGVLSSEWKSLQNAVDKYVANFWNQNVAMLNAGKKYDKLIGDYKPKVESGAPYQIVEAEKEEKGGKGTNKALKAAREEYQAVMAAIEVYYKQQAQVINDAYLKQKITVTQREQELAAIENRFLNTRIAARAALHDDKDSFKNWDKELLKMFRENISNTEDTANAIENIISKNLKDIGDKLRRFGDSEDDGIWKNLEEDRLKVQEQEIKLRQEVEKIINQYDFTGQVTDKFMASLQKLDIFYTRFKKDVTQNTADSFRSAKEAAEAGMKDLYAIYPELFSIDIDSEEGLKRFRALLSDAQSLGEEMSKLDEERLKELYYKTLEYGDAMTEAEKKSRERQLKIAQEQYKRTPQFRKNEQRKETDKQTTEVYKQAQELGLASSGMVQDQETLMYKHRLEAAMDYYNYLKSTERDTREAELKIQEEVANLSSAITAQVKEKMSVLRDYGKTFEELGSEFGAAMIDDWGGSLEARQKAFENFARAVGEVTKNVIMDWVRQKIEHAILRAAMVDTEKRTQEEMEEVQSDGSTSLKKIEEKSAKELLKVGKKEIMSRVALKRKRASEEENVEQQSQDAQSTIVTEGQAAVTQAVTQIGMQAVAAKKTQAAESVTTEAAETSAKTTLGIASGAAKTIGELGWWGIPLVAVITALLNGLLSMAMSKVSSLFGGAGSEAATPTKLVTGMLTYDSGNVQSISSVSSPGASSSVSSSRATLTPSTFPVLGDDGRVYQAGMVPQLSTGIYTHPTVAPVNGQPAIIGERGPEIVIGRRTTAAIMENRPDLLAGLIHYDKMYSGRRLRTFDSGNLSESFSMGGTGGNALSPEEQESAMMERVISAVNDTLEPTLKGVSDSINRSAHAVSLLEERLAMGIDARIARNGKNGIINQTIEGMLQEKVAGRNDKLKKLLG